MSCSGRKLLMASSLPAIQRRAMPAMRVRNASKGAPSDCELPAGQVEVSGVDTQAG